MQVLGRILSKFARRDTLFLWPQFEIVISLQSREKKSCLSILVSRRCVSIRSSGFLRWIHRRTTDVARTTEIAEKSDDFTHYRITYFQFNLPGRRRTIERKTIILPRTNEDEAGVELAGWSGRKGRSEWIALAQGQGQDARDEKGTEMARKDVPIALGWPRRRNITGWLFLVQPTRIQGCSHPPIIVPDMS